MIDHDELYKMWEERRTKLFREIDGINEVLRLIREDKERKLKHG